MHILAGDWPTDLQVLHMQRQFLNNCVSIELSSSEGVQQKQEDTRLLGEYTDQSKGAVAYGVEKLVVGGVAGRFPT